MRKAVGLVFFLGCAGSESLEGVEQKVADPSPSFSITTANFINPTNSLGTLTGLSSCGSAPETACTTDPAAQMKWGTPAETGQSGLGFQPEGAQPVAYGVPFELGVLTHFNWPVVGGTSATGATLKLGLLVSGVNDPILVDGDINIPFEIDETPNTIVNGPCPYPTADEVNNPCSDRVRFVTATFNLGAILNQTAYDLRIEGFVQGGTTVQGLISDERQSTTAVLMGSLREHCIDTDDDAVCDENDNCVNDANLDQLDTDGDSKGDACDACPQHAEDDPDGDGVCGLPDPCPCDADWKNHGEYVTCVVRDTREQVREGSMTEAARATKISLAAQSSCGK